MIRIMNTQFNIEITVPFRISAHRGYSKHEPENTLASAQASEKIGVDITEFDVRRSADGVWILHHDQTFYGKDRKVKDLRYDELKAIAERTGKILSTLDEVITGTNSIELNVESKGRTMNHGLSLAAKIDEYDCWHRTYVSSFSRKALRGVRKRNKDARISLLGHILPWYKWVAFNQFYDLYSINPHYQTLKKYNGKNKIRAAKRLGIEIHPWGLKSMTRVKEMAKLGCDVIATDYPLQVMKLRQQITAGFVS